MVSVNNPLTRPRELALGFHMGNNRSCREQERERICSLLPGEAVPQVHGGGPVTREGVQGRLLSAALPGRTEGFYPPGSSSVRAEANGSSTSQLLQLQPLPAWVATGNHVGKPTPGPASACLSADAFIPPCGAIPSSFNTNFTISIATWQGKDYEIKLPLILHW